MAKDPLILKLNSDQIKRIEAGESFAVNADDGSHLVVLLLKEAVPVAVELPGTAPNHPNTEEKVELFASLFVGRSDVYANRWENKAGKSGYSPACDNIWKPGVCQLRPRRPDAGQQGRERHPTVRPGSEKLDVPWQRSRSRGILSSLQPYRDSQAQRLGTLGLPQ